MNLRNTLPTFLIPILLVGGTTFAAVQIAIPHERVDDIDLYYPRDAGTTWTYKILTDGDETGFKTTQVVEESPLLTSELGAGLGSAPFLTATTIEDRWDDLFGRPYRGTTYLARRGDKLMSLGRRTYGKDIDLTEPAATSLKLPLEVGTGWRFSGVEAGIEQTAETEIIERGSYEVSGLRFDDCLGLTTDSRWTDSGGTQQQVTVETHLCRGVGLVHQIEDSRTLDITLEQQLVSFVSPERSMTGENAPSDSSEAGITQDVATANSRADLEGSFDPDKLAWTLSDQHFPNFPMTVAGDIAVMADSQGWVTAWNTDTGDESWTLRLEPPLVAAPTIFDDTVFLSDAGKKLFAVDALTGTARWVKDLPDIAAAPTVGTGGTVVSITQDRVARGFDADSGELLWSTDIDAFPRLPAALADDIVLVPQEDHLDALDVADGSILWSADLDDEISAPVSVTGDTAVVADVSSGITAIDLTDGTEDWDHVLGGYRVAYTQPAVGSDVAVFVAESTSGTTLMTALSRGTGRPVWETRLPGPVYQPPMIIGDEAIAVTDDGEIVAVSLSDGSIAGSTPLRSLAGASGAAPSLPPVLADGRLIVQIKDPDLQTAAESHFAFDLRGEISSAPRISSELIPTVESLRGGIVPTTEGSVAVGTFDGDILSLSTETPPERLAHLQTPIRSLGRSGAGLLADDGSQLQALDPLSGSIEWNTPIGVASGSRPVTGPGVVAALTESGITALDATSGDELWHETLNGVGVQPPTVFDGDVFVAKEGLRRYDGATGDLVWERPGIESFNPIGFTGSVGLVHAYDVPNNEVGWFGFDPATGETLWKHAGTTSFLAGFGAADGVFIVADDQGRVAAYRAADGAEMWSLQLRTALDTTPFVKDGVVALVEKGRSENFITTYYKVRYHDLATGRLLGWVEPSGSSYTSGVTSAADEALYLQQTGGILTLRTLLW